MKTRWDIAKSEKRSSVKEVRNTCALSPIHLTILNLKENNIRCIPSPPPLSIEESNSYKIEAFTLLPRSVYPSIRIMLLNPIWSLSPGSGSVFIETIISSRPSQFDWVVKNPEFSKKCCCYFLAFLNGLYTEMSSQFLLVPINPGVKCSEGPRKKV